MLANARAILKLFYTLLLFCAVLTFGFIVYYGKMQRLRVWLMRLFCQAVLWIFDIKIHGNLPANISYNSLYIITNHSSYIDVPIIGSMLDVRFTPKRDIDSWGFFGLLTRMTNPIYIERKKSAIYREQEAIRSALAAGDNIVLFPEGTTSTGNEVLPFKPPFFNVVESANNDALKEVKILPVSIVYTHGNGKKLKGRDRDQFAWYGDMELIPHLWALFKLRKNIATLIFHAPQPLHHFSNRKEAAAHCEKEIRNGMESVL